MTKYYHMIIQHECDHRGDTRREYISKKQGSHPIGWRVIGVCGYHEKPSERSNKHICPQCGYGF
jgi:hypothetical protein